MTPRAETIIRKVSAQHRIAVRDVMSRCKRPNIVRARDAIVTELRSCNRDVYTQQFVGDLLGLSQQAVMKAERRSQAGV